VIDVIFDSRPVICAARLLLVCAAFVLAVGGAFIVSSTVARMRNGDWLKRAGPFEVSETTRAALEHQVHLWQRATHDSHDELEVVQARLAEAKELIITLTQGPLDDKVDS